MQRIHHDLGYECFPELVPPLVLPSLPSPMWGPIGTIIIAGPFDHFRWAFSTFWRTSPLLRHNHTNSMMQNPAWEAKSIAASHDILCILWNTKVHYRFHNSLPLVPILSQINTVYVLPKKNSFRSVAILCIHLRLGLQNDLFPSSSKPCLQLCPLLNLPYGPPISFFIWTPGVNLARNSNRKVPHVVSATPCHPPTPPVTLRPKHLPQHPVVITTQSTNWWWNGTNAWMGRWSNPGGSEFFRTRPNRPWGPPSLLYNGYRVFPGGKAAGAWR